MDVEQIKKWIEEELSKGRSTYKQIRTFCNKLYRYENKDKVSVYNSRYYKRHTDSIKKHTDLNKSIKRHSYNNKDIKRHTENNTDNKRINLNGTDKADLNIF